MTEVRTEVRGCGTVKESTTVPGLGGVVDRTMESTTPVHNRSGNPQLDLEWQIFCATAELYLLCLLRARRLIACSRRKRLAYNRDAILALEALEQADRTYEVWVDSAKRVAHMMSDGEFNRRRLEAIAELNAWAEEEKAKCANPERWQDRLRLMKSPRVSGTAYPPKQAADAPSAGCPGEAALTSGVGGAERSPSVVPRVVPPTPAVAPEEPALTTPDYAMLRAEPGDGFADWWEKQ